MMLKFLLNNGRNDETCLPTCDVRGIKMMKNWLREIVEEFKSLPLEQKIAHLNDGNEHDLVRAISIIENAIADGIVINMTS